MPTATPPKEATGAPAPAWPTPKECVTYNPDNLRNEWAAGIHTIGDADKVILRVTGDAGAIFKACFLGATNNRASNNYFIFEYWRDASGNTTSILDEKCSNYNENKLAVQRSGDGWRVADGHTTLQMFDTESDARNGRIVLAKYSKICRIGDPASRPTTAWSSPTSHDAAGPGNTRPRHVLMCQATLNQ